MRTVSGVFVPLIVGICLPVWESRATAAETATIDDANWNVVVEPGLSPAGLLKRVALQDTATGEAVPSPVEPGGAAPADEFAPVEIVPLQAVPAGENGDVEIVPGKATDAHAEVGPVEQSNATVPQGDYWTIYKSIPFLRSQYEANPSYRHDATMELLTGHARPTVIREQVGPANYGGYGPASAAIPPYITDVYLGQIPTFVQRYLPPAIPFGYPLVW